MQKNPQTEHLQIAYTQMSVAKRGDSSGSVLLAMLSILGYGGQN